MSGDVEIREDRGAMAMVLPGEAEGEIVEIRVDLNDPIASAVALDQLRTFEKGALADAKRMLTDAVLAHYRLTGQRTIDLPGRLQAEVKAGQRTLVDPDILEQRLRDAGMPDEVLDTIIKTTQERSVDLRKAKTAATANEAYAAALQAASTSYQETPSVTVKRR